MAPPLCIILAAFFTLRFISVISISYFGITASINFVCSPNAKLVAIKPIGFDSGLRIQLLNIHLKQNIHFKGMVKNGTVSNLSLKSH